MTTHLLRLKGVLSQLGALQVSDGLAFSRKIVTLNLNAICVRNFLRRKSFKRIGQEILQYNPHSSDGPFDNHPLQLKWSQEQQELTMGIPRNIFYSEVVAMFECDQCDYKPATLVNLCSYFFTQATCEHTKILSTEGIYLFARYVMPISVFLK